MACLKSKYRDKIREVGPRMYGLLLRRLPLLNIPRLRQPPRSSAGREQLEDARQAVNLDRARPLSLCIALPLASRFGGGRGAR